MTSANIYLRCISCASEETTTPTYSFTFYLPNYNLLSCVQCESGCKFCEWQGFNSSTPPNAVLNYSTHYDTKFPITSG